MKNFIKIISCLFEKKLRGFLIKVFLNIYYVVLFYNILLLCLLINIINKNYIFNRLLLRKKKKFLEILICLDKIIKKYETKIKNQFL